MTKKQKQLWTNWLESERYDLYDAYDRPSLKKIRAQKKIFDEMEENDGYGYRVTTFCRTFFTAAYKCMKDGTEYLIYHTPSNRYEIALTD